MDSFCSLFTKLLTLRCLCIYFFNTRCLKTKNIGGIKGLAWIKRSYNLRLNILQKSLNIIINPKTNGTFVSKTYDPLDRLKVSGAVKKSNRVSMLVAKNEEIWLLKSCDLKC